MARTRLVLKVRLSERTRFRCQTRAGVIPKVYLMQVGEFTHLRNFYDWGNIENVQSDARKHNYLTVGEGSGFLERLC